MPLRWRKKKASDGKQPLLAREKKSSSAWSRLVGATKSQRTVQTLNESMTETSLQQAVEPLLLNVVPETTAQEGIPSFIKKADFPRSSSSSKRRVPREVLIMDDPEDSFSNDEEEDDLSIVTTVDEDESSDIDSAQRDYEAAVTFASDSAYEEALEACERGMLKEESAAAQEKKYSLLYYKLLHCKAGVLGRMGNFAQSLRLHKQLLETDGDLLSDTDRINVVYMCGRLSTCINDYGQAVEYHELEFELTRGLLAPEVSMQHLALSRIMHELARLYKQGLADYAKAMECYKHALSVEVAVFQAAREACRECASCSNSEKAFTSCPDRRHKTDLTKVSQQIIETKQAMGRICFENGDLDQAVRLSFSTAATA